MNSAKNFCDNLAEEIELAESWLRTVLDTDPMPATSLFRFAASCGFSHEATGAALANVGAKTTELDDELMILITAEATRQQRRSRQEKRLAILEALRSNFCWSDRRIAEHCSVNHKTVARVRSEMFPEPEDYIAAATDEPDILGNAPVETRVGIDGKRRPATRATCDGSRHATPKRRLQPAELALIGRDSIRLAEAMIARGDELEAIPEAAHKMALELLELRRAGAAVRIAERGAHDE